MHELGIVFYLIDMVEDLGRTNSLTHVSRVTLELGEVSGVLPDYLQDCWKWAVGRTELMTGCELDIEKVEAKTICNSCHEVYPTLEFGKVCPHCKSEDTVLLQGLEMELKEIEAYQPSLLYFLSPSCDAC